MANARLTVDPELVVSPVHRRTFGSFVEHLGRCVYTGIHEPTHPTADEDGFRQDVLDLVRELGVTTVRYPGGNFVSGYRWEDGVGPVEDRPARLDLAWHSLDPNTVGVDEFMRWTRKAGVEPMMAVNLGTRGVLEAVDLLDYCNGTAPTAWAKQRAANGSAEPHNIRMWCLGNEMDGPWQTGHKTAHEYGRIAAETARAMRQVDPTLELVACGSSAPDLPTFGSWEREVLTETYDQVDYISIHRYYEIKGEDTHSFLGSAVDMDAFIDDVVATADGVRAALKAEKRMMLSFDEWNVWYQSRAASVPPAGDDWPVAPVLLEDRYSAMDAVVVGNMLITLLRHSDRVTAASQAQLVNVIAPIMTEPGGRVWKQTIFHPFAQAAALAKGSVLRVAPTSETFPTAQHGDVPAVDAVATWDEETGTGALLVVNRHPENAQDLAIDLSRLGDVRVVEATTLHHDDPFAANTADAPDEVAPVVRDDVTLEDGTLSLTLPAISWSTVALTRA
ncbi:arabinosylfuranosidase ArfA [Cellulomonas triticagri]|uniref:non-reducing end alpha-L-arabinofuranosidase n=1 Tax=Cellulomonas triticagri TaxID=2483352 RepID=A0A3M2J5C4_9CELL|nr:alpha-N-arabinofuranosidase [Cellulomonas triticagri]RMI09307.1 alpha-N-arabinofuranosidase [Cellulomonas triticagri]